MSLSRISLLLLSACLTSCGFQLQGALTLPESMQRTYVQAADRFTPFYRDLVAELRRQGVEVVDTEATATATFTIYADETGQRVLSVSARNIPTEYEVFYTIRYGVVSGTDVILEARTVTRTQEYIYDTTVVLGKAAEEQKIREALVQDLVRFITRQLSAQ
ncbi:MAG: LPS assembly lipoprotein LptE [Pseudomonadota bacterium]